MNEQNWQLGNTNTESYVPNKLPFFKDPNARVDEVAPVETKSESQSKLNRVPSHVSGGQAPVVDEFAAAKDNDVDTELRDLLYDNTSGQVAFSELEPLLLQLPGTLPFAETKPHTATALEEMIDRLSQDASLADGDSESG